MATAVILGHPAAGHINPTLPVTAELVRRGERVVYFATEPFRARIERTGAEFRAYGPQALFERSLGSGGLLGGMAGLMQTSEEILADVIARTREEQPSYLLVEAHAVWGNLAAQHLQLPAATLCAMFAVSPDLLSPAELLGHLYGQASADATLLGLEGLTAYFERARALDRRFATQSPGIIGYLGNPQGCSIVFTSRAFQPGGDRFPAAYRFTGPASAGDAEDATFDFPIDPSRRLLFISLGTMYNDDIPFYEMCFEAFGGRGDTVVIAAGHRIDLARLPAPPPGVVVRASVPQQALLARTSLFITHGGINSAHEAMLAGVPMLVLPSAADHHIVARQVAEAGAGEVLDRGAATADSLRAHAARVLDAPAYAAASRAAGDTLRAAGGPARAADEILAYVSGAAARH